MDPRDHGSRTPGPGRPRSIQMHRGATTRRPVPLRRSRSNHCTRPVGHTPPRQPPATAQLPLAASQSPPLPMIAVDSTTTPGRSAAPEAKVPAPSAGTFAIYIRVRSSVDRTCAGGSASTIVCPSARVGPCCGLLDGSPSPCGCSWGLVLQTPTLGHLPSLSTMTPQLTRLRHARAVEPLAHSGLRWTSPHGTTRDTWPQTPPPEPHHRRLTGLMFPTTAAVGSSRRAATSVWDRLHTRSDCLLAATAPGLRWPGS